MNLVDIFKGNIFRKKKSESEQRIEELEPEPKTDITVEEVKKDAEKERDDQPQSSEPLTRYTDEECMAMIKNQVVPFDAPYWVRDEVEKRRLKRLAEEKPPEEEMRDWMKSRGATSVGR